VNWRLDILPKRRWICDIDAFAFAVLLRQGYEGTSYGGQAIFISFDFAQGMSGKN